MYIREINKNSTFVKRVGDAYLVDEVELDGIKTIRTTKNILKAQQFTTQNVYTSVYNSLDEHQEEEVIQAHQDNRSYGSLSKYVSKNYEVITASEIDYGYGQDIKAEAKLLEEIGLGHILIPIKVVTQSIDNEKEIEEE